MVISQQTPNTAWHHTTVTRARREETNDHTAAILWFEGLSGAGKSTIAHAVEERRHRMGHRTVLDGHNVRHGLRGDRGISNADLQENNRSVAEMTNLFADAGIVALMAFISSLRADRDVARRFAGADFIEFYYRCPIEAREERDVKGLYGKARAGEIKKFTGISSPYEEPDKPELIIDTDCVAIEKSVTAVMTYLQLRGVGRPDTTASLLNKAA